MVASGAADVVAGEAIVVEADGAAAADVVAGKAVVVVAVSVS